VDSFWKVKNGITMAKSNYILFFVIIVFNLSCSINRDGKSTETSYHINGNIANEKYFYGNMIVYSKTYYKNGSLKSIFEYDKKIKYEELTGYYKTYYRNTGVLESEMHLLNGEINGEQKIYKSDGALSIVGNYINNILVGKKSYYNSEGKIKKVELYDAQGELIIARD
jgi:antitoxin component YwqK of YwqJK toxin-antitoxin module